MITGANGDGSGDAGEKKYALYTARARGRMCTCDDHPGRAPFARGSGATGSHLQLGCIIGAARGWGGCGPGGWARLGLPPIRADTVRP